MQLLSKKSLGLAALALLWGCGPVDESAQFDGTTGGRQVASMESLLTTAQKRTRCGHQPLHPCRRCQP
ncbi:hypothetical protein [Archangium sp.]|uniref:hypothetical protein n=1 Tax=Archangium sp. TaxID=1872627 RepID=UPI002D62584C|nr:hypothetical protein [Archangium sp.]HYO59476.1 hypothetical protein [Archangium sp.]